MQRLSRSRKLLRTFLRNRTSFIGACMSLVLIIIAILSYWLAPYDPLKQNVYYRLTPPEMTHIFGTDEYGRDVFREC